HAAQRGISVLDKYYSMTDQSYIPRFGLLLHPTFKTDYMQDQEWEQGRIDMAVSLLRQVWKVSYAPRAQASPSTAAVPSDSDNLYDFNRYRKHKRTPAANVAIDQLEAYLAQDAINIADPLAYWNDKRASGTWPELTQMALDYLTVPAMSVDVEWVFSFGRVTVSLYRHSLSSKSIQCSIVFGNQCKEGLVNDIDLVQLLCAKAGPQKALGNVIY
ncbi:hypothetical protein BOTBODRAFT_109335, partial [Botryobasidium botryosum FD-172 SS1]